ncbi:protein unhypothetical protein [Limosa lapponica baueri]|uniref:Protein UNC80 central region domain-containing protein n=1 Tax=Limosa lapponica baueri TaxID=1758121 RepID=A0A2I0T310_LIMLA|nr:protein unhypothetical protein [Limosa lapponica baueri]
MTKTRIWLAVRLFHGSHEYCKNAPVIFKTAHQGCHSFDDHLTSNQEGGKSKNVVNLGAIRQGMKRFQFLLNCCEPGTIPDASILAAALDLKACKSSQRCQWWCRYEVEF